MDMSLFVDRVLYGLEEDHSTSEASKSEDTPAPGISTINVEDSDGDQYCIIIIKV